MILVNPELLNEFYGRLRWSGTFEDHFVNCYVWINIDANKIRVSLKVCRSNSITFYLGVFPK